MSAASDSSIRSLFNETVIQKKLDHEFVEEGCDGPDHSRMFRVLLRVGTGTFRGSGNTKKAAKCVAIRNYFEAIEGKQKDSSLQKRSQTSGTDSGNTLIPETSPSSPKPNENYIGNLHELCAKSSLPQPQYNDSRDPGSNKYIILCEVEELSTQGESMNKKDAKQDASFKMMIAIGNRRRGMSSMSTPTSSPSVVSKPPESKRIKETAGLIKSFSIYVNFPLFLQELGESQGFQVLFDMEKNEDASWTCIVQIGVFPVIVGVGIGASEEEARNLASKRVVSYIKS